jgi:Na+-transporting NADH:ubiquinone oxidoreductase subunit NqrB
MRYRHWLLMFGAPLLIAGAYWAAVEGRSGRLDWLVLVAAAAVGLCGVWSAPWRRWMRVAVALAYVPAMTLALGAAILLLECSTGNCL